MPKAPKAPDYKGVIKAIKKSAKKDKKLAHKQMKWAQRFYRQAKDLNKDVVADLREVMEFQLDNMKEDRARYEEVFQPLEDEQMAEIDAFQQRAADFDEEVKMLKAEALAFKSEANQKYMAGKAQAGVAQGFAAKKAETERALLDMGVNPNAGASRALTAGLNLAEGGAMAAAGTTAADAARVEGDVKYQAALDRQIQAGALAEAGLGMQGEMVKVGQTYPGQVAVEAGQVGEAGAQAIDSTIGIADAATRARALAVEYRRLNANHLATWSDTVTNKFQNKLGLYQAQIEAEKAEADESSGIGSLVGTGAAVLRSFLPGFKGGGAVEAEHVPGFKYGGDVGGGVGDPNVSGTGGATGSHTPTGPNAAATSGPDKIPARLTEGEFVVPKHVVEWKGQEYFQKLIKSAPEAKQSLIASTGAEARPVPVGAVAI